MNRQDLIAFSQTELRRRGRVLLGTLAFVLIWMAALFATGSRILDRLGLPFFLVGAAIPIVVLVGVALKNIFDMPKCPHCGIRLYRWLLTTAIATGNCGNCGRSIED